MFDWMNRKKRFFPLTQMGRYGSTSNLGDMFTTFRVTDNRFYWLSSDSINPKCINGDPNWSPRVSPATVYARIDDLEKTPAEEPRFETRDVFLGWLVAGLALLLAGRLLGASALGVRP